MKVKRLEIKNYWTWLVCDCGSESIEFVGFAIDDRAIHRCRQCGKRELLAYKYPAREESRAEPEGGRKDG